MSSESQKPEESRGGLEAMIKFLLFFLLLKCLEHAEKLQNYSVINVSSVIQVKEMLD